MQNIPLTFLERRRTDEINEIALVLCGREANTPFLYTGGPTPMALALGGAQAGHARDIKKMRAEDALVIPNVEIEIDVSGAETAAYVQQPVGAIVIGKALKGVTCLYQDRSGIPDVITTYFDFDVNEKLPDNGDELLFPKWRVVKRDGDRILELATFEATQRGDR